MSQWSSAKAKRVLAALLRIGWSIKRESGSHKILSRSGWPDVVFAFQIKKKLARKCLPVSQKILDLNQKIYNTPELSIRLAIFKQLKSTRYNYNI